MHSEIRDAAAATIEAEQWLQSNGWRDCIIKLGQPESGEWLAGYRQFRALLERFEYEAVRDVLRASHRQGLKRAAFAACVAAAVGFAAAAVFV